MRIVIAAVGRLKQGPERELAERYRKRAADAGRKAGLDAFDIIEIKESRAGDAARRMLEESIAIANLIPERAATVLLDERGESMSSGSFAGRLQGWRSAEQAGGGVRPGRRRRPGAEPARQGRPRHRLWAGDLAASARANHAAGAALSRDHDPGRTPVSPRLMPAPSLGHFKRANSAYGAKLETGLQALAPLWGVLSGHRFPLGTAAWRMSGLH